MWTAIELLTTLFDSWLGTFFVLKFNNRKWSDSKLSYGVMFLVAFITTIFDMYIHFSEVQMFLVILVLILFGLSFKENNVIHRILPAILYGLYLAMITTNVFVLYSLIFDKSIFELITGTGAIRLLVLVSCKLFNSFMVFIITKYTIKRQKLSVLEALTTIIFPVISIAILTVIMRIGLVYDINNILGYVMVAVVGVIVINVLIYYMLFVITEAKEKETNYVLELQKRAYEEKFYKELEDMYMANQLLRHDFKNQCLCILEYLETNDISGAKIYMDELFQSIPSKKMYVGMIDTSMAFIINSKCDEALRYGITPTIYIDKNVNLNMKSVDSVRLIGNLLDNAIEASKKSIVKKIDMEIVIKQGCHVISIKNSIDHSVIMNNKNLTTTKRDKTSHGFGLISVEKIITKYDGLFQFYEEEGYFCVQVIFPKI
jgi:hypothetical protein